MATALITAGAALAGVLLASVLNRWRDRSEHGHQRQMRDVELRHERALRDRQYRRQVYVDFITAYDSRKVLDANSVAHAARTVLHGMDIAFATMRITSTPAVIAAADQVRQVTRQHFCAMHDANKYDRYWAAMLEDAGWLRPAMDAFIEAARKEDTAIDLEDTWTRVSSPQTLTIKT
jgi:hypothetical protein